MPQSHAQVWLHIVFSTKERQPFLKDPGFRAEMFRMLAYHVKEAKCVSGCVGGHVDHVHLLTGISRTITIAKLVELTKSETSQWAKKTDQCHSNFQWQSGYGAFSVSHSLRSNVDSYIRNQEQHHAKLSFKKEYRQLCKKHDLDIDERYVWD